MLERVYFNTEDEIELVGLLERPTNPTKRVVISVHGMQSNCLKRREDILSKEISNAGVAYFAFNNRGAELMTYTRKTTGEKILNGGSVYEDVLDGYYDIKGAINKMLELGYTDIYLQGHSLGCTKIVYTYNKLKNENNVKNINYSSVIEALNIKNRIKRINYIYDKACSEIDEYNKIKHIDCEFKNGKCMNQHNTKRINGCCRLCRLQSSHGCTSQNITCKLFFCDQLEKKYKTIKFNDIKILKCLSLTNRIIVKDNYFETKENFLRTLYLNSIIVFSIKVVINIIKNGVYLHKIRKNITKGIRGSGN